MSDLYAIELPFCQIDDCFGSKFKPFGKIEFTQDEMSHSCLRLSSPNFELFVFESVHT